MDEQEQQVAQQRPTMIAEAEETVRRLELVNKQLDEKLQRLEALGVERTLSGRSTVNIPKPEESDAEYADKVMRGEIRG